MIRILAFLLMFTFGFGIGVSLGVANENTLESPLAEKHLENLNLLVNLSRAGISTFKAATVDPRNYQEAAMTGKITATVETDHAIIYDYNGPGIPDFLKDNFDRIFEMTTGYLNLKVKKDKVVVWVMDFETLQQIPAGPESCFMVCPTTLGALYAPIFNYLFFTPRYMNDYYVTHELLHYFNDECGEEVVLGFPQIIRQQCPSSLSLQAFLKQNEEAIVVELSQIIIRKSLASFLIAE